VGTSLLQDGTSLRGSLVNKKKTKSVCPLVFHFRDFFLYFSLEVIDVDILPSR
jgi:hypothetical protein